jgi:hypothetical protein
MTNDLTTIRSLRASMQAFRNSTPRSSGGAVGYMKFSKGDWSFGKDETPLDLEGLYLLHPSSLMHGWICWRNGSLFHEVLLPFTQQLPLESSLKEAPEPAPDSDDQPGYQHQMAFQVVAIEGKQAGQQFTFKTGTVGGRGAVDRVVEVLMARMDDVEALGGAGGIYPVLEFGVDSYKHKTRGKIFVPVITVVGWSTNEPGDEIEWIAGDIDEEEEAAPPPPVKTPATGRKRIATA